MNISVFLVSTKRSDHPIQTQTLRVSCHLCRWSGKVIKVLFFSFFLLLLLNTFIITEFSYGNAILVACLALLLVARTED